jgi:hypothetical protein
MTSTTFPTVILTTCSACAADVTLDLEVGTATVTVPSNGRRGALHVPAHDVVTDVHGDTDDLVLVTWECPVPSCEHADSYDLTA